MMTVKEVAELTGVSVRTLQYYDEIGVFKPTKVTEVGYRLYDDEALSTLQQILFFKELDFSLKDIKFIMGNKDFDKLEIFKKQKELIKIKRNRLNRLLGLLERLEKGEKDMSFKEFDLSEYISVLEKFKSENTDEVIKNWGSIENFDKFIEKVREDEINVAQNAVKYYGSTKKYTEAIKKNLDNFTENMKMIKNKGYVEENERLMNLLLSDLTLDVKLNEVQNIIKDILNLMPDMDMGENYFDIMIDGYLNNESIIDAVDKKYGAGASKFMGEAYRYYFDNNSENK
ncbi:MerR family transcriptional regulator [Anaerofustis stercorihominis]|uniref:MerR family transcriptional regulator n=1 Tax=Anaerofustis stercorihominis TaxID=214853 RepID=A0A3E3DWT0_9FIRM|nr:MerR family transcriptional regulator [Anaerofustis stercorihominis]RGD73409.1 MerR family transcriptional regulator [Anaerofustis stercorihominis]